MKHARMSSGPFCMVRFLRDADGCLDTFTQAQPAGDAVVLPARTRIGRVRVAVVPTSRIGRGRLTLNKVAHA